MVFPEEEAGTLPSNKGERVIRLVFNGSDATGRPLITQMALDEKITANILYASTRCIGDKVYGKMLLGLPDDRATIDRAIRYLCSVGDVSAEEVDDNVR